MSKVVLVGHCGADTAYLKLAVKAADPGVAFTSAESDAELKAAITDGADLVLLNRVVDYGFESTEGVDIVAMYMKAFPATKMLVVTNYAEVQAAAIAAGALPGFGKREIGSPKVKELLQKALAAPVVSK